MMTHDDLRDGLYVQHGQSLYKVSTVYPERFTATLLWEYGELPPRTAVCTFRTADLGHFKPASTRLVNKVEDAYGLEPR